MMLRYSFGMAEEADAIETAVNKVLDKGLRTADNMSAVSYTHLPLLHDLAGKLCSGIIQALGKLRVVHQAGLVAVSYTHLDVYKRQGWNPECQNRSAAAPCSLPRPALS